MYTAYPHLRPHVMHATSCFQTDSQNFVNLSLFMCKYSGALKFFSFSLWDVDLLGSPILIFFLTFHDCSELEWDHMADMSASPTLLLLCRSISAESSLIFCLLRLIGAFIMY
jgi:hypothetical protein